jgi:hypothetical protein
VVSTQADQRDELAAKEFIAHLAEHRVIFRDGVVVGVDVERDGRQ